MHAPQICLVMRGLDPRIHLFEDGLSDMGEHKRRRSWKCRSWKRAVLGNAMSGNDDLNSTRANG
jgi:hypothetical protein